MRLPSVNEHPSTAAALAKDALGIACVLYWPALKAIDGYQRVSVCIQKAMAPSWVNRFYAWICTRRKFEMNMIEMQYNLTRPDCRLLPAGLWLWL